MQGGVLCRFSQYTKRSTDSSPPAASLRPVNCQQVVPALSQVRGAAGPGDLVMDLEPTVSKGKKISRKWTEEEVAALATSIARVCGPKGPPDGHHSLNWAEISKGVPGRSGKQCREKYKVRGQLRARALGQGHPLGRPSGNIYKAVHRFVLHILNDYLPVYEILEVAMMQLSSR